MNFQTLAKSIKTPITFHSNYLADYVEDIKKGGAVFNVIVDLLSSHSSTITNQKPKTLEFVQEADYDFISFNMETKTISFDFSKVPKSELELIKENSLVIIDLGIIFDIRKTGVLFLHALSTLTQIIIPTVIDGTDHGRQHIILYTTTGILENFELTMSFQMVLRKPKQISLKGNAIAPKTKDELNTKRNIWNLIVTPQEAEFMKITNKQYIFGRKRIIYDEIMVIGGINESNPIIVAKDRDAAMVKDNLFCTVSLNGPISFILKQKKQFTESRPDDYINGFYAFLPSYKEYVNAQRKVEKLNNTKNSIEEFIKMNSTGFSALELEKVKSIAAYFNEAELMAEWSKLCDYIKKENPQPFTDKKSTYHDKIIKHCETISLFHNICAALKRKDGDTTIVSPLLLKSEICKMNYITTTSSLSSSPSNPNDEREAKRRKEQ